MGRLHAVLKLWGCGQIGKIAYPSVFKLFSTIKGNWKFIFIYKFSPQSMGIYIYINKFSISIDCGEKCKNLRIGNFAYLSATQQF